MQVGRETGHTQTHNKNNTTHDQNKTTNDRKNHHPSLSNDRSWRGDGAYHLPGMQMISVFASISRHIDLHMHRGYI